MSRLVGVVAAVAVLTAACATDEDSGDVGRTEPSPTPAPPSSAAQSPTAVPFAVTSTAFADGQPIPQRYSCKGENVPPPLAWSGVPADAAALALVVDDPDAVSGRYIHWVVTDMPPDATGDPPAGGRITPNSGGDPRYLGPCPPAGTGVHHYRFTLYATRRALGLSAGPPAEQALAAIERDALGQARLIGTYRG